MKAIGPAQREELLALLSTYCDGTISDRAGARLETLLRSSPESRSVYIDYLNLHVALRSTQAGADWPAAEIPTSPSTTTLTAADAPPVSSLPTLLQVIRLLPGGEFTVGTLVILAVIVAYVTLLNYRHGDAEGQRQQIATAEKTNQTRLSDVQNPIGEITATEPGSVSIDDVSIARAGSANFPFSADRQLRVRRGVTRLRLKSGVELAVQGPAELEPGSNGNIWLHSGQLVALVPPGSRGFTVQTPQAAVIDLGTEFSVRAAADDQTEVHVLQGEVSVVPGERGKASFDVTRAVQLRRGEMLRVDASGRTVRLSRRQWAERQQRGQDPKSAPAPSHIDLADVVAGGNGQGAAQGGIDPRSGELVTSHPTESNFTSDGQFHRVPGSQLIDGVFIPHPSQGPVQLDSAGHRFDGFGATDGNSWNFFWGGSPLPNVVWPSSTVLDLDYSTGDHSVIGFHANKGITFNLAAIAARLDGAEVAQFVTQVGNASFPEGTPNTTVSADLWIFVDGELRASRRRIYSGNYRLELPLRPENRFLTIVCTDGGDTYHADRFILGDPRILLRPKIAGEGQPAAPKNPAKPD